MSIQFPFPAPGFSLVTMGRSTEYVAQTDKFVDSVNEILQNVHGSGTNILELEVSIDKASKNSGKVHSTISKFLKSETSALDDVVEKDLALRHDIDKKISVALAHLKSDFRPEASRVLRQMEMFKNANLKVIAEEEEQLKLIGKKAAESFSKTSVGGKVAKKVSFPTPPSFTSVDMPRKTKEYAENTTELIESVNEILTKVGEPRSSMNRAELLMNIQKAREYILTIQSEIYAVSGLENLGLIANDLDLRRVIDEKISSALEVLESEGGVSIEKAIVCTFMKGFIEENRAAIAKEEKLLMSLPNKEKERAIQLLKRIIQDAYNHKGTKTLSDSLGAVWGARSTENQALHEILKKDYSNESATTILNDMLRATNLIRKGFDQMPVNRGGARGIPPAIDAKIQDLHATLREIQKSEGTTPQERYNVITTAKQDLKVGEMSKEEARKLVMKIVHPGDEWPTSRANMMSFSQFCKQEIQDSQFEALLEKAGIDACEELCSEVADFIRDTGFLLSQNQRLASIQSDITDPTKMLRLDISQVRSHSKEAVALIRKAFSQKKLQMSDDLLDKMDRVEALIRQL